MKTSIVTPVALVAVLAGAVSSRESVAPVSRESPGPAACLPDRSLGSGGGDRFDDVILLHARRRGLDPRLVKAVIAAESQFAPGAVSRCGARGLMQLMPATAAELGVKAGDLSDPETNISAGTEYLALLFKTARRRPGADRSKALRRVIAAYYSGPAALNGEAWPEPTQRYVRTVLSCYGSRASAMRMPRETDRAVASLGGN